MRSSTFKKVLLGALLLVFVYIWWGNLQMFLSGESYSVADVAVENRPKTAVGTYVIPEYQPPKVNPFRRSVSVTKQKTEQKPAVRRDQPAIQPLLSTRYTLAGVVADKVDPQAVLRFPDGRTRVITLGDTVEQWEVLQILEKYVVCKHDKTNDTLWLGPHHK